MSPLDHAEGLLHSFSKWQVASLKAAIDEAEPHDCSGVSFCPYCDEALLERAARIIREFTSTFGARK